MPAMQKKVIAKYISDRVKWFAFSIKSPEALRAVIGLDTPAASVQSGELLDSDKEKIKQFQQDVIDSVLVSGGAIASMLLGDEVNDLDIYFKNKEVAGKVALYYVNTMLDAGKLSETYLTSNIEVIDNDTDGVAIFIKSQGVAGENVASSDQYRYFEIEAQNLAGEFLGEYIKTGATRKVDQPKHTVSFMTSNAISLANGVQLIFRFCGDADQIHRNFDFTHCTNYWTQQDGLVYNPIALQALLEKRLVYQGSLFPVAAMFRLRKFITRGYRISAGELTKIAFDISRLDLTNPFVLRQQLMGCDIAYFNEVIQILAEGQAAGRELDRTYLVEVIDRVFNDHDIQADTHDGG